MDENTDEARVYRQPEPSPDLESLGERLLGSWEVSGGAGEGHLRVDGG